MGIFAAIIMGAFLYTGSRWMLPSVITGTTTSETIILNVVPVVLAAVVVGVVINIFR